MFIGQRFDQEKVSTPLQVKSFQKETSVTSATVFNSIIKTIDKPLLSQVFSIMAATTAVNLDTKLTPSNAYFIPTKSILHTLKIF